MKYIILAFLILITACGTFEEKNELLIPPVFEKEYKDYRKNKKIEDYKKEISKKNNSNLETNK